MPTSRRPRACPRSAGPRCRNRAPVTAPRRAPSAPDPRASRANRRAGNPRCRRVLRCRPGSPRQGGPRGRRCAHPPAHPPAPMPESASPVPRPQPHRAPRKRAAAWTRSAAEKKECQPSQNLQDRRVYQHRRFLRSFATLRQQRRRSCTMSAKSRCAMVFLPCSFERHVLYLIGELTFRPIRLKGAS